MKEEMKRYEENIIKLMELGYLTEFQALLLVDVFYYKTYKDGYKLIKTYLNKLYSDFGDEAELLDQIDNLVERKMLFKTTKKSIYNHKFVTHTYLNLDEFVVSSDNIEKLINKIYNSQEKTALEALKARRDLLNE